jgi:hypothetical protein
MMRTFICALLIASSSSYAVGCDRLYQKQLAGLSGSEKETLRKYSFVLALHQANSDLPTTVISEGVIKNCPNRIVAQKYFDNKISGETKFPIKQQEFVLARKDIAIAACKAINTNAPWKDGVSHEIYNIVDDRLFPYWNACVIENIREKKIIDLRLFTSASFIRPDKQLLPELNRLIDDTDADVFDLALAFILKKNMGDQVSLDVALKRLRLGKVVSDYQISSDAAINSIMRLLRRHGKVNKGSAIELEMAIFGV